MSWYVFTDILNQQLKMYTSLSQTCSDVRMVQSLVPIWEVRFIPAKCFSVNFTCCIGSAVIYFVLVHHRKSFKGVECLRQIYWLMLAGHPLKMF